MTKSTSPWTSTPDAASFVEPPLVLVAVPAHPAIMSRTR